MKLSQITPDWLLQVVWWVAGIGGSGAFWYFLSQRSYHAALWTGFITIVVVGRAVCLHKRNDFLRSEQQTATVTPRKAADKQYRVFVGESITPEYLIRIFREHTSIQGANLTAAYLGKWMKVSGSLGDVISTNPNRSQLTFERAEVPLTERSWFDYTDFYMIFKKPWIDRLAIAKRGDKLTVIGQIERIDGVSVQLENCELVDSDSN